MKRVFNSFYERTGIIKDAGQRNVASRVSALLVEGTILFSVMGTLGVDTSPLIAAAGVTGATIGFASKDFGANFVAGIALSGHESLRIGNEVSIGVGTSVVRGTVVDWDTRYLYLKGKEHDLLSVPNNLVLTSVVTHHNAKEREAKWTKNEREWKATVEAYEKQTANKPTDGKSG
ncbi:hypothetical protein AGDE_01846 [Angomonas deanei]|uniref:Mechanosensitive ion channel, putative n=1 Tax=Angomonas deanei TaxID=59799 RepID=S9VGU1_9TRYP|nr:hypothetical protein AGDE_02893 [Angomonas deanei]EPY42077.1 hypothetical protein AGDE_01846 [Angomonas deanei]CAD2213186.1 Mechanosensitive ion channel, putative [Angomonas deanei]|eukprot:EPY41032.1 hypothetical protein AGDE_02893 [Angomonas deanei]